MYQRPISRPRDPFETLVGVLAAASREDFLLAIIPVAFAVALVRSTLSGVSLAQAMAAAGVVGVVVVADACVLNPPTDRGSRQ